MQDFKDDDSQSIYEIHLLVKEPGCKLFYYSKRVVSFTFWIIGQKVFLVFFSREFLEFFKNFYPVKAICPN